jgi:hypothetical protein
MKIEEYNNFYHVDISTQINNPWDEDTALGIVKDSRRYSIKIRGRDKSIIKQRYILNNESRTSKRHNLRVIAIAYSYLLYKALIEFNEARPLLLCRDVRPERLVIIYLRRIANFFGNYKPLDREIKFRKRIEFETMEKLPKSLAGKYVRKVYQGKIEPNQILDKKDIEEIIILIGKIL